MRYGAWKGLGLSWLWKWLSWEKLFLKEGLMKRTLCPRVWPSLRYKRIRWAPRKTKPNLTQPAVSQLVFTAITLNLLLVFNIFTKFSPSLLECAWYGEDQIFIELNIRINRLWQNIYIVDVVSCSAYVLLRTWASLMATLLSSPPKPSRWFHWLCCRFIIPLVINEFFYFPHSRQSLLCLPSPFAIYFALGRLHMIVYNTCSAEPHNFKTLVDR